MAILYCVGLFEAFRIRSSCVVVKHYAMRERTAVGEMKNEVGKRGSLHYIITHSDPAVTNNEYVNIKITSETTKCQSICRS